MYAEGLGWTGDLAYSPKGARQRGKGYRSIELVRASDSKREARDEDASNYTNTCSYESSAVKATGFAAWLAVCDLKVTLCARLPMREASLATLR